MIEYSKSDGVCILRLGDPPLNAIGFELLDELGAAIDRANADFVVNRLFIPYLKEAFRFLEDGADPRAVDAAMVEFGFAMGPLTLIDMAGMDILAFTDKQMCGAFSTHMPLSQIATSLVEQGSLGQKTGSGVYRYEEGDYTPENSPATREIISSVQKQVGKTP